MAILVDISFKGLELKGLHARIGALNISPTKDVMSFQLEYRANAQGEVITTNEFNTFYNIEGENPYVQAYAFLETLPEYAGCEKV